MIEQTVFTYSPLGEAHEKQKDRRQTFVLNKLFDQLLRISQINFMFLKTFNSEFLYIKVWHTVQNSKPLEVEDKINVTLVINESVTCKIDASFN